MFPPTQKFFHTMYVNTLTKCKTPIKTVEKNLRLEKPPSWFQISGHVSQQVIMNESWEKTTTN